MMHSCGRPAQLFCYACVCCFQKVMMLWLLAASEPCKRFFFMPYAHAY